jgi:hypothetical protein
MSVYRHDLALQISDPKPLFLSAQPAVISNDLLLQSSCCKGRNSNCNLACSTDDNASDFVNFAFNSQRFLFYHPPSIAAKL